MARHRLPNLRQNAWSGHGFAPVRQQGHGEQVRGPERAGQDRVSPARDEQSA
jgi:hypothetical protein